MLQSKAGLASSAHRCIWYAARARPGRLRSGGEVHEEVLHPPAPVISAMDRQGGEVVHLHPGGVNRSLSDEARVTTHCWRICSVKAADH
jgi:hypothetical protein